MKKTLFLAAVLLAAPSFVLACDDVLMAVIYGRDKVSEFDQKTEAVSGALRRVAERSRTGSWVDAQNAFDEVMNGWVAIYRQYLAEPPEGLASHPDWPGLLRSFSVEIQELGDLLEAKQTEPVHEKVRKMQATLINTYFQGGSPAALASALKTTLEPLEKAKAELGKPGVTKVALQLQLTTFKTRLETMLRVAPSHETPGKALLDDVQKAHDRLSGDSIPADFAQDLEKLSTKAAEFKTAFDRPPASPAPAKP